MRGGNRGGFQRESTEGAVPQPSAARWVGVCHMGSIPRQGNKMCISMGAWESKPRSELQILRYCRQSSRGRGVAREWQERIFAQVGRCLVMSHPAMREWALITDEGRWVRILRRGTQVTPRYSREKNYFGPSVRDGFKGQALEAGRQGRKPWQLLTHLFPHLTRIYWAHTTG